MSDINHIIKKCETYLMKKDYIKLIEDKDFKKIKKMDKNIINNLQLYTKDKKIIKIITDYYNLKKFDFYKTLEFDLLKLYKETNNKEIRNYICVMNQNLVINFVKVYAHNDNYEDLKQVGIMGLIQGIENFDCNSYHKLSSYVCFWIKKEIMDYFYNLNDTIRKPKNIGEDKLKINKFIDSFYKDNGYYPNDEEIATATSFSEKKIRYLKNNNRSQSNTNIFSLDQQLRTSYNDNEIIDWYSIKENDDVNTDEIVENEERQTLLKELIADLSPNQQYIILSHYGFDNNEPKTFQQIGNELNMSRQAVEQNEKRALDKIKMKIKAKKYHF